MATISANNSVASAIVPQFLFEKHTSEDGKPILSSYTVNSNINTQNQDEPCSSASALSLENSKKPSHVSLLAGEYLLFMPQSTSENSIPLSSITKFQKCIDVNTKLEYNCKAVSKGAIGIGLLAKYHRLGEECNHVCRAHEIVLSPKYFYLIIPRSHGNVYNYLLSKRHINEIEAVKIFSQMVRAVQFCHEIGIVLRDLKMGTFVFTNIERTDVKLESLDEAVLLSNINDDYLSDTCGCPNYISPEKVDLVRLNKPYPGKAADVWGLGIILYTMLVGQYPFSDVDNNNSRLFTKIHKGEFTIPNFVSDSAKNLICNMLNKNLSERFDCGEILQHCWLTQGVSFESLKNSYLLQRNPFDFTIQPPVKKVVSLINFDQVVPES